MGRTARRGRRLPAVPARHAGRRRRVLPDPARRPRDGRRARPLVRPARRHFRLGYGWPTPDELEQGLAALLASAVEAWTGHASGRTAAGAAIGNALLEMDRQIFRDVPRVEEMVKTGSETVGLSGDGGLVVRLPTSEPAADTNPGPSAATESTTDSGRPGPDRSGDGPGRVLHGGRDGQLIDGDVDVEREVLADEPLPASSATFQLRPHASRSTLALRWNPA